jgi:hypothetical protein
METVEFNCERCGKLMAVGLVDQGMPVECPHCHATVQAPAPPEPPVPEFRVPTRAEQESIFTPQEESVDDLFGADAGPRLEMPAVPALEVEPLPGPTEASEEPPLPEAPSAPLPAPPEVLPPAPLSLTPEPGPDLAAFLPPAEDAVHRPAAPPEPPPEMPTPAPPRRPQRQSVLGPLLLIFLIPYSLVATAAIAWLIYQQRQVSTPAFDPLERLPEPKDPINHKAAPDGPRRIKHEERVKHDSPLPDKLTTSLKAPLTVGDIEVTPLAVERTPLGELLLTLKLKNVSRNVAFDPLPDMFVRYAVRGLNDVKPYTYVALGPDPGQRIYGAYLDRLKKPGPKGRGRSDNVLRPGEAMVVRLGTDSRYKPLVDRLDRPRGPILWRIQLRRGFVQVHGKDVSATAVVGVRIDPGDIPPAPAKGALLSPPRPFFPQSDSGKSDIFLMGGEKSLASPRRCLIMKIQDKCL